MKIEKVNINGLCVIEPSVFNDSRGFFYESYNLEKYKIITNDYVFVQDNISKSKYGTIRGLHYQIGEYAQGKLVSVIIGKVFDVAVDIRFGSPTFGKYFGIELSEENKKQLWIPPGFAHGFSVLSDEVIFTYKCTANYNKESERSIIYNDSDLRIDWKVKTPIVSEKDLVAKKFGEIGKDFVF
ncbi:MAG: dTDP-4-dehydrorhamnose 3,5-epimerase [Melioribacteraceae bacterium]|nr:dTDP-4-dehydrorhamnose 3,5-epimerase [Melioribacteraceae bacterium]